MKLNEFLPRCDTSHQQTMRLPSTTIEKAYAALLRLDFAKSPLIRLLFRMRGLQVGTFQNIRNHFIVLYDNPPEETVMGFIGRPWDVKAGFLPVTKDQFVDFNEPNYAKLLWSFLFVQKGEDVEVTTETRVLCTDPASRAKFRIYWFFVRPFSILVRKEMLRLLKLSFDTKKLYKGRHYE